ncbi:hypothetical protein C8R46DRAFT_1235303 [Mycena filopes]|nr:hypothetical protein C8R46DRAFT_1235303 [Mycena filopes]
MHPSLRLSALDAFPISTRRIALAAAKGSLHDLERLRNMMTEATSTVLMLPVVYAALDPARIPNPELLDTPNLISVRTQSELATATLAWAILHAMEIPEGAALDLWDRIWVWFQFIDTYRGHLNELDLLTETTLLLDIVVFTDRFHDNDNISDRITATAGFYPAVARAWKLLLDHDENMELKHAGLTAVLNLIAAPKARPREPGMLSELAEGVGGSYAGLASLVLRHVSDALGTGAGDLSGNNVFALYGGFTFISIVEEAARNDDEDDSARRLLQELMRNGLIKHLVRTSAALSEAPNVTSGVDTINKCFLILRRLMDDQGMHLLMAYALDEGLLRTIVLCARRPSLSKTQHHFNFLLREYLPSSTVYCDFIPAMEEALAGVETLVSTDAFIKSETFADWTHFLSIAQERIALWESFDSRDLLAQKACDELECGIILEKPDFQRCSACQTFYYCSRVCQVADWKEGGHRETCSLYRNLGLTENTPYLPRERSFMRAVLHLEYVKRRQQICRDAVLCLQASPDAGYFVVFDFVSSPVTATVHSLAAPSWGTHDVLRRGGAEWVAYVARAARSEGTMTIHAMRVREGSLAKYWVVPLRAMTSELQDALKLIAGELASGSTALEDLDEEVTGLLEQLDDDPDEEEIH